jgi:hypothetical protein
MITQGREDRSGFQYTFEQVVDDGLVNIVGDCCSAKLKLALPHYTP